MKKNQTNKNYEHVLFLKCALDFVNERKILRCHRELVLAAITAHSRLSCCSVSNSIYSYIFCADCLL